MDLELLKLAYMYNENMLSEEIMVEHGLSEYDISNIVSMSYSLTDKDKDFVKNLIEGQENFNFELQQALEKV